MRILLVCLMFILGFAKVKNESASSINASEKFTLNNFEDHEIFHEDLNGMSVVVIHKGLSERLIAGLIKSINKYRYLFNDVNKGMLLRFISDRYSEISKGRNEFDFHYIGFGKGKKIVCIEKLKVHFVEMIGFSDDKATQVLNDIFECNKPFIYMSEVDIIDYKKKINDKIGYEFKVTHEFENVKGKKTIKFICEKKKRKYCRNILIEFDSATEDLKINNIEFMMIKLTRQKSLIETASSILDAINFFGMLDEQLYPLKVLKVIDIDIVLREIIQMLKFELNIRGFYNVRIVPEVVRVNECEYDVVFKVYESSKRKKIESIKVEKTGDKKVDFENFKKLKKTFKPNEYYDFRKINKYIDSIDNTHFCKHDLNSSSEKVVINQKDNKIVISDINITRNSKALDKYIYDLVSCACGFNVLIDKPSEPSLKYILENNLPFVSKANVSLDKIKDNLYCLNIDILAENNFFSPDFKFNASLGSSNPYDFYLGGSFQFSDAKLLVGFKTHGDNLINIGFSKYPIFGDFFGFYLDSFKIGFGSLKESDKDKRLMSGGNYSDVIPLCTKFKNDIVFNIFKIKILKSVLSLKISNSIIFSIAKDLDKHDFALKNFWYMLEALLDYSSTLSISNKLSSIMSFYSEEILFIKNLNINITFTLNKTLKANSDKKYIDSFDTPISISFNIPFGEIYTFKFKLDGDYTFFLKDSVDLDINQVGSRGLMEGFDSYGPLYHYSDDGVPLTKQYLFKSFIKNSMEIYRSLNSFLSIFFGAYMHFGKVDDRLIIERCVDKNSKKSRFRLSLGFGFLVKAYRISLRIGVFIPILFNKGPDGSDKVKILSVDLHN